MQNQDQRMILVVMNFLGKYSAVIKELNHCFVIKFETPNDFTNFSNTVNLINIKWTRTFPDLSKNVVFKL